MISAYMRTKAKKEIYDFSEMWLLEMEGMSFRNG